MPTPIENCTAVILAGGENKRMPVLKSFIDINGETIIHRQLAVLRTLFHDIMIITNDPCHYMYLKIPLYGDVYPIRGPLTGIVTALLNSRTEWIFVAACDMPFLDEKIISYMASQRNDWDCVIPLNGEQLEPLMAFYSQRIAYKAEKALLREQRKIQILLSNSKVRYINDSEIKSLCPHERTFINLNTPDDLRLCEEITQREISYKGVRVKRGDSL